MPNKLEDEIERLQLFEYEYDRLRDKLEIARRIVNSAKKDPEKIRDLSKLLNS